MQIKIHLSLKKKPGILFIVKRVLFIGCILVSICLVIFSLFIYINVGPKRITPLAGLQKVNIHSQKGKYSFYKNGKAFVVKGGVGDAYIEELAACGGNTITCWDTAKLPSVLENAAKNHISVIIGLDIPASEEVDFYLDDNKIKHLYQAYRQIVLRYKDDPSLLAWCLGNEVTMPFSFKNSAFYQTYNLLISMMQSNDNGHPIGTTTMNVAKKNILNICWRIPSVDFICINTYNRLKEINTDMRLIQWAWDGPFLIGEWAPNGGWEATTTSWQAPIENTSTKKAEQYADLFTKYMPRDNPRFLGSVVFYWGTRQEYTHTWYSIFDNSNAATEVKEVLKDCWNDTVTKHISPKVDYMLVDGIGVGDNIAIGAATKHKATILLPADMDKDSLKYNWEMFKEDWTTWGQTWAFFKKPATIAGLIKDSTKTISFLAPPKEGPYRIFVTVTNSKGYCATANTPIYVIAK